MKKQDKSIHRNALFSRMRSQQKPIVKEYLHDMRVRLKELRQRLYNLMRIKWK